MTGPPQKTAIVLSGGGARGAYEAGVLSYIFQHIGRRLGRPVHFDIITGTSVGAVHACYLAGSQQSDACGQGLIDIWRSLSFDSVMGLSARAILRIPWRMFGYGLPPIADGSRLPGLFDTSGLEALVAGAVRWESLRDNIDSGRIIGLAVTATEIASGRAIVFVDRPGGAAPPCSGDPLVVTEAAHVTAQHALASAAIPMIFPAIRIGARFYSDGGLRMNTPLAPALRMGADRVLVIGLRHPLTVDSHDSEESREAVAQSPIYLAGKALNALLLDRVEYDLERLRMFNDILRSGMETYGASFVDRINEPVVARRGHPYKVVDSLFIRPSRDLGVEAADCLRGQLRSAAGSRMRRMLFGYLAESEVSEADVLSYLYFDACYAERLIEMGRHDAAAAEDDLVEFFRDAGEG